MTPWSLYAARLRLGLTQSQFAAALKIKGNDPARTIRRWENGERGIPGPVESAVEMMLEKERTDG